MRPRLIAVDDAGALVAGYASPIMLQGGHGGSPWMTLQYQQIVEDIRRASMRPRLIAVDDVGQPAGLSDRGSKLQGGHGGSPWMTPDRRGWWVHGTRLQGGHGGSPWMTWRPARRWRAPSRLQGGHGGSPWMTSPTSSAAPAPRWLQGGHGGSPWMTLPGGMPAIYLRVASMRPRLIAVDDPGARHQHHDRHRASMRPRLIAVDDTQVWVESETGRAGFNEATADRRGGPRAAGADRRAGERFNEATADRRGGRDQAQQVEGLAHASMRPRLIAVDDFMEGGVKAVQWELQGGHGGSPWMTRPPRPGARPVIIASMRPRLIAVDDLSNRFQIHRKALASMRPRLIAVDDDVAPTLRSMGHELQGGHGGSPWMTRTQWQTGNAPYKLQGGHGGSPWMTCIKSSVKPTGLRKLQGGHGGSPWMT